MVLEGWRAFTLGEVTENFDALRVPVKKSDRKPGPYPYYGASGVVDYVADYIFDGEYLLIAEDGENLRTRNTPVAFPVTGRFWVNNHAHIVRGNDLANTRFLAYTLARTDISGYLTGSTMPKLTQGSMNRIPITLPSRAEQDDIVEMLGTLDDKIELNRRMNETLEAMARAIFKSWFVDFDPVRAKMEGRQPVGMSVEVAELFPGAIDETGQLPEGWSIRSILGEADLLSGGTPKTSVPEYWDGQIKWASAKDVSQCSDALLVNTERRISEEGLENSSTKIVDPFSTVVVARGATTGRMAMFGEPMAMNQTCYALRSVRGTPFHLYCHTREFIGNLVHAGHGSVFNTVTTSTFESSAVVTCPDDLAAAFEDIVRPLFQRILNNLREVATLAQIRDTLLPKLLSGEICVRDAETATGAVT